MCGPATCSVFSTRELTADAVLASACLPFLFQAVEIDGEHYWDGGYMGNPVLFPLFYDTDTPDVLIVHINPIHREARRAAHEIDEPGQRDQLQLLADQGIARGRLRPEAAGRRLAEGRVSRPDEVRADPLAAGG